LLKRAYDTICQEEYQAPFHFRKPFDFVRLFTRGLNLVKIKSIKYTYVMSNNLRNLANRYTLNSYPYMDSPSTQDRWSELGSEFTDLVSKASQSIDVQEVVDTAADTDLAKKLLPKEEPKVSWLVANKKTVFAAVAGLGLLMFLKHRS
jgi:hypothetical protein